MRFRLTCLRPHGPAERTILASKVGVSLGRSDDRTVTVAVLGSGGRERDAGDLANRFIAANRDPTVCQCSPAGAAVLDMASGALHVVAPPIGFQQVYWRYHAGVLSIASSPTETLDTPGEGAALSLDALYRYIYFHMIPGPGTVLAGVSKLCGGHRLSWSGTQPTVSRYWKPNFARESDLDEAAAATELRQLLQQAVAQALANRGPAGAFLSGGLDSSTVAGFAARERPGMPTVTMGFDAQGYDEMEYARIASRRFGTRTLEYYVTPEDVLSTLPRLAASFAEPFGNSSAAAAYHCARIAREHGLELLLAGDGGDELFGGNERYATQLIFERYARVPAALRRGLLEPAVNMAAQFTTRFPIGKARNYIQKANVPLPDRLQSYNFLHMHDPAEVFSDDLLAQVDRGEPLRALREEYSVPATATAVDRMLFLDWKFTLHDNDLVKVGTMCDLAGVDVAYPMLDQRVIDFSRRIPADWKVRGDDLRWFYKRAMSEFLPREIIEKTKHGFGLPFGVWTRTHEDLRRLAEDSLASLSARGFFKPTFLQQALRLHREGHASYYGELVWILSVLELWLQAHRPEARL